VQFFSKTSEVFSERCRAPFSAPCHVPLGHNFRQLCWWSCGKQLVRSFLGWLKLMVLLLELRMILPDV